MADVLYELSTNNKSENEVKLRVPLSCIIDYKGFRCLAIATVPIYSQQGPVLGFYGGSYIRARSDSGLLETFQ